MEHDATGGRLDWRPWWGGCLLAAVAASLVVTHAAFGGPAMFDTLPGCATGAANGLAAFLLASRATACRQGGFFRWGVLGNASRFLVLLGIVLLYRTIAPRGLLVFGCAMVASGLVFTFGEVLFLHVGSMAKTAGTGTTTGT